MGQCLTIAQQVLTEIADENNKQTESVGGKPQSGGRIDYSNHNSSALYASLPAGAERVSVRNVYDGDTLTLTDGRRVRFLGIDTPEIKEQQPYALEAKAYTKDRCNKQDIWISFEPGQSRTDHYDRLLAFVWVREGDKHICMNESIVGAGYASAYIPNKSSKLHNWDKFLALQKEAILSRRGMWKSFQDHEVVKTKNGSAYHRRDCEHISSVRNLTTLKASEALSQGLHACRTCL